ncbi:glutaredoxin family protein [Sporosarcina sp. resist]|uniref:glutaredoxin family protein n=1 Tax=Sporosarcina sp. resist TaxID=2762563 RepID=UPI00164E5123|nr:glutaredoxin family protein [Sporosarcina sp. resist]QNK89846.1 glutaredoxin family protein [Sporosarcina sp. resist]
MEIIVYSSSNCGFCTNQKEFLTYKGIVFEERDIDNDVQYFQELKDLGASGIPFTIVKEAGEIISTLADLMR